MIDTIAGDILSKLPKPFDEVAIKRSGIKVTPTSVVLFQEIDRFNRLLVVIAESLQNLQKAFAGEIGMDDALENMSLSLYNGQLPDLWRKFAPDTCKQLGDWLTHLKVCCSNRLNTLTIT